MWLVEEWQGGVVDGGGMGSVAQDRCGCDMA